MAEDLTALEAFQRFERAFLLPSAVIVKTSTAAGSESATASPPRYRLRTEYRRDGIREEMFVTEWKMDAGRSVPKMADHRLWLGDPEKDDRAYQFNLDKDDHEKVTAVFVFRSEEDKEGVRNLGHTISPTGRLPGDPVSCFEIVREFADSLRLVSREESIQEVPCYHLALESPYGEMHFWLDPSREYLPRKITVHKEIGDIDWLGNIMGEVASPKSNTKTLEFELAIEQITTEVISDRLVITSMHQTKRIRYSGDRVANPRTLIKLDYDLEPDFDSIAAFQFPEIADGTPVYDADFNGIRYEWRSGGPVPRIPASELASLDMVAAEVQSLIRAPADDAPSPDTQIAPLAEAPSQQTKKLPVILAAVIGLACLAAIGVVILSKKRE